MNALIIVPTYNEADNVAQLAERVVAAGVAADLLLVDDTSPDRTANISEALFRSNPAYAGFRVMRRRGARGLGRAYRDGFALAVDEGYERIIQMDADLSHDPIHLPELLAASADHDLVIGSRYCSGGKVENWPRRRILLSKFAVSYVRAVTGITVADSTAGFRCWTRSALTSLSLDTLHSEGYSFQVEMCYRACAAGMRIAEIPITFVDRQFGHSKISRTVLAESFVMPWRLRFQRWRPEESNNASYLQL